MAISPISDAALSGPRPLPTPKKKAAPKPPRKTAPQASVSPYPGYLSPQQQLALATQSVTAALDPQTLAVQQQIDQAKTDAMNQAASQRAAYAALGDIYNSEAQNTDQTYTDAANRQATFAKGFSDAMQQIQQGAADQGNKLLANNGAPSGQDLSAGNQGDVVYALGGYNPASVLNAQGAAFKTAALGMPAEAKGLGIQAADQANATGAANVQTLQNQLAQVNAQRPSLLTQALNSIQSQQSNAYQDYLAANKGSIFGSDKSGYFSINPSTGRITQLTAPVPGATSPKVFGSAKSGYFTIDPNTNKVTQLTNPVANTGGSGSTHLQVKTVNGHTVVFDPTTGTFTTPGTGQPIDPNTLTKPPKPLSASVRAKAVQTVNNNKQGYWGSSTDGSRLSRSELVAAAKASNESLNEFMNDAKAQQAQGVGYVPAVADKSKDDREINHIYTGLISTYGIDAKTAFNLVAKSFPGWGNRNRRSFFGTGGVGGATPGATTGASSLVPKNLTTPAAAQQYAQSKLSGYGWDNQSDWDALVKLWDGESGWSYTALNKSSGAAGIPQALGHKLPSNYKNDPAVQINWGMNYIKNTYGSPARAWAFWQATVNKNAALAPPDLQSRASYWISKGYGGY